MARKKKQPAEPTQSAQEVQENTIDDTSIDKGFGIAQAAFLMSRAAKRYNKPAEEITLKEALEMVKKDPAELPNKDDADIKEALDLTIRTAEELTGKPAAEITGADINKVLGENPPFVVSDETATAISSAADMARDAQRVFSTIATTINNVFHSAEFKAIAESAKIGANFTTAFAQHSAEISIFLHKAEEFNREILPFIVLEVADRTGEQIINADTGNAEPFSLEEIRAFLAEGETPDKEKSPFESEISRVLGLFSFDGKPATDEARELLEAANKRKATYTENIEVVETITDIAESIEQAPDTEKEEVAKQKLPALKQALPAYLKIAKGLPTDKLLFTDKNNVSVDKFDKTKTGHFKAGDIDVFIENYEKVIADLGVKTDKLLSFALFTFTKNNFNGGNIDCSVKFDLRDYAYFSNYDVFPHNNTDKEKKRANKRLDKVRKDVNKNLDLLFSLSVSWKDKNNKSKDSHDYDRIRLLSSRGQIKNNFVYLNFTPEYAAYLTSRNVIGQYPAKLLSMDSRQATAYKIAKKLFDHYFIDNNIINDTNDILSIKRILPFSGLASYEEVQQKDRGHWIERIKEPLEKALDILTQQQILSNWEYTHEKKKPLSDDEAAAIINYQEYEKLYLHFTPFDELDQQERIEAKQKRIAAAEERKAKRKQAAINRNIKKKADKEREAQGAN